ncbi:transposase [Rhizobium leguminosarum]|uniref:transposase n=1 Tax=Rhizobium leguminosarum TaxID=384 RepID=UPI001441556C|nr:hypothetical protein [Rhizobium leguminosarum bv. viciae]
MQRIVNINRESLHAFIRDNTAVGSLLVTDGNTAYRRLEDRGHQTINLSAVDAPPAHEVLPWVHRLWRDVVGDTRQWKHEHEDQILDMVRPDRLDRAKDYAVEIGCDIFDALDDIRR